MESSGRDRLHERRIEEVADAVCSHGVQVRRRPKRRLLQRVLPRPQRRRRTRTVRVRVRTPGLRGTRLSRRDPSPLRPRTSPAGLLEQLLVERTLRPPLSSPLTCGAGSSIEVERRVALEEHRQRRCTPDALHGFRQFYISTKSPTARLAAVPGQVLEAIRVPIASVSEPSPGLDVRR
jgi:hypothetical protein